MSQTKSNNNPERSIQVMLMESQRSGDDYHLNKGRGNDSCLSINTSYIYDKR